MPKTITIPLGRGKEALIDEDDWPLVSAYRWRPHRAQKSPELWYARAIVPGTSGNVRVLLHRVVMSAPPGIDVHHKNIDGLDCRRGNLRMLTRSEHSSVHRDRIIPDQRCMPIYQPYIERKPMVPLLSGRVYLIEGVYQIDASSPWRYCMTPPGGAIDHGPFGSESTAINAYAETCARLFGEAPEIVRVYS